MTELNQVYKCDLCENIVEVLHTGVGELVCCGQPMDLLESKTEDEGMEKHVPVVEVDGGVVKVEVGDVLHPMQDEHYIEWVELVFEDAVLRKNLSSEDDPKVDFLLADELKDNSFYVRILCNIHGLWRSPKE